MLFGKNDKNRGCGSGAESLPSKRQILGLIPSTAKKKNKKEEKKKHKGKEKGKKKRKEKKREGERRKEKNSEDSINKIMEVRGCKTAVSLAQKEVRLPSIRVGGTLDADPRRVKYS